MKVVKQCLCPFGITGSALQSAKTAFASAKEVRRATGTFHCWIENGVVVRYAARVNGLDALALTKLDVLDGFNEILICTAYTCGSETLTEMPSDLAKLA